jgi:hypothetical protein
MFIMVIVCRRCFRRAQIPMPPIGARLRCTTRGERQVFGERKNTPVGSRRRRREIGGVVKFDRPAPGQYVVNAHNFDDAIDDLFERTG